jgi:drug/metabolite transporter (DMT)-like permease
VSTPPVPPVVEAAARGWAYVAIAATVAFTVYGQMVLKWRLAHLPPLPEAFSEKMVRLVWLVFDPWIFSGFFAAFLASLAWMAALDKLDLTYAYPFMALNFVVVLVLGAWFLGEPMTWPKVVGVSLIVVGTVVAARG